MPSSRSMPDSFSAWAVTIGTTLASLFGLSGILYGTGLLVLRAHYSFLGIWGTGIPDATALAEEGGRFFYHFVFVPVSAIARVDLPTLGFLLLFLGFDLLRRGYERWGGTNRVGASKWTGPMPAAFITVILLIALVLMAVLLETSWKVTEPTDVQMGGKGGTLNVAIDHSQKGDLYAHMGDIAKAIAIKKAVLPIFQNVDSFNDIIAVLGSLRDLYLVSGPQASFAEALKSSTALIELLEKQTPAMAGRTLGLFLKEYEGHYHQHFALLLTNWAQEYGNHDTRKTSQALEALAIHHDRMLFRPLRRDFAIYRELGDQLDASPELRRAWDDEIRQLTSLENDWQSAFRANKNRKDYIAPKEKEARAIEKAESLIITPSGFEIDSPFAKLGVAKTRLPDILEDSKRRHVGTDKAVYELPASLAEVRQGMNEDEAIIVYLGQVPMYGIIIATDGIQLKDLKDLKLKEETVDALHDLLDQLRDQINGRSPEAEEILKQVAEAIWHPLGEVPRHLTIVLNHHFMGIPFESLPTQTGEPVISQHTIRYAFGLSAGLGAHLKQQNLRRALVAGAASFPNTDLKPLPSEEVIGLREYFTRQGVAVSPLEGLPAEGRPLFATAGDFDVMHISTHSVVDPDAAVNDSLAFPQDRVTGFDVAISPLRTRLLVLSACRLFEPRKLHDLISTGNSPDLVTPVSGVTAAAFARMSPQIVSTLWDVDAVVTRIFMQRFYDALLREREPATALAVTKRDFTQPKQLEKWMKSEGLPVGPEILDYKKPYYWAPFVLAIRGD